MACQLCTTDQLQAWSPQAATPIAQPPLREVLVLPGMLVLPGVLVLQEVLVLPGVLVLQEVLVLPEVLAVQQRKHCFPEHCLSAA